MSQKKKQRKQHKVIKNACKDKKTMIKSLCCRDPLRFTLYLLAQDHRFIKGE